MDQRLQLSNRGWIRLKKRLGSMEMDILAAQERNRLAVEKVGPIDDRSSEFLAALVIESQAECC